MAGTGGSQTYLVNTASRDDIESSINVLLAARQLHGLTLTLPSYLPTS